VCLLYRLSAIFSLIGPHQIFRVEELKEDTLSRWMAVIELPIIYYLFLFGTSKDTAHAIIIPFTVLGGCEMCSAVRQK